MKATILMLLSTILRALATKKMAIWILEIITDKTKYQTDNAILALYKVADNGDIEATQTALQALILAAKADYEMLKIAKEEKKTLDNKE